MQKVTNIGLIGAGQMATALASGIAAASPSQYRFVFFDPDTRALDRLQATAGQHATVEQVSSNQEVVNQSEVVFLAVKPHLVAVALENVSFESNPLLISIVAGTTEATLKQISGASRIVRAMPNTPCLVRQGAIGYTSDSATEEELEFAHQLFATVSTPCRVTSVQLDAVTGLSGSGPAFVYTFAEAMIDAGVLNGLPRDTARQLAIQTILGAASLLKETGQHPAASRDQVTSPGGTTIAGMKALEACGFRNAVMSAVNAATERAIELG